MLQHRPNAANVNHASLRKASYKVNTSQACNALAMTSNTAGSVVAAAWTFAVDGQPCKASRACKVCDDFNVTRTTRTHTRDKQTLVLSKLAAFHMCWCSHHDCVKMAVPHLSRWWALLQRPALCARATAAATATASTAIGCLSRVLAACGAAVSASSRQCV